MLIKKRCHTERDSGWVPNSEEATQRLSSEERQAIARVFWSCEGKNFGTRSEEVQILVPFENNGDFDLNQVRRNQQLHETNKLNHKLVRKGLSIVKENLKCIFKNNNNKRTPGTKGQEFIWFRLKNNLYTWHCQKQQNKQLTNNEGEIYYVWY